MLSSLTHSHFDHDFVKDYFNFSCSLTESPGQDAFDVKITSSSGRVRTWVQKLDRHDGSFIVRYRLFASYPELIIQVTHKGESVAKSPYKLKGREHRDTSTLNIVLWAEFIVLFTKRDASLSQFKNWALNCKCWQCTFNF